MSEDEDMQAEKSLQINNEVKENNGTSRLFVERRGVNSDRRVNNNDDYLGPARRMNIDRRK